MKLLQLKAPPAQFSLVKARMKSFSRRNPTPFLHGFKANDNLKWRSKDPSGEILSLRVAILLRSTQTRNMTSKDVRGLRVFPPKGAETLPSSG